MNRTRAWLVLLPVLAAGVLVSHALAYRLTATPTDRFHAYLEHAPQVLLVLALCGIVLGGFGRRREAPAAYVFPLVAMTTFVGPGAPRAARPRRDGSLPPHVAGVRRRAPAAGSRRARGVGPRAAGCFASADDAAPPRLALRPRFDLPLVAAPAAALRLGRTSGRVGPRSASAPSSPLTTPPVAA